MSKNTLASWSEWRNAFRIYDEGTDTPYLSITTNGWQWTSVPVNRVILKALAASLTALDKDGTLDKFPL